VQRGAPPTITKFLNLVSSLVVGYQTIIITYLQ